MIPRNRTATHPGEILREEYFKPLRLKQTELARGLGISVNRLNEILREKRGITADTAWRLAHHFKCSPEFWMNLQTNYELTRTRPSRTAA